MSFLQGQVSNDTRRLAEGRSLFAAYSSPRGRVLALMHLLPHSSGVIAILPRELIAPTLEGLRKFVLRAKVKIEDTGELLSVAGLHGTERLRSAAEGEGIAVAAVNGDPNRHWAVGAGRTLAECGLAGDVHQAEQIERDWRLADVRAGLPQIYLNTREAFVAQMLNLDLLDGISFSKGCYTGQEIIARTQHLGRIKRRLYRLQLPAGEWHAGRPIRLSDGRAGRLVEVVRTGDGFEALAVLPVEAGHAAEEHPADGESAASPTVAAAPLPLPYAL